MSTGPWATVTMRRDAPATGTLRPMHLARRSVVLGATLVLYAASAAGAPAALGVVAPAGDDSYTAHEDHTLTVAPADGVLKNDDLGGATKCVFSVDDSGLGGTVTVQPDGSFVYQPYADFVAMTSFTYKLGSATSGVCNDSGYGATVTIDVQSVNDPPTAVLDQACSGGVTVAEDSGAFSSPKHCAVVTDFGSDEEAGQVVNEWVVLNDNASLFAVQPSLSVSGKTFGDLHFTPAANAHGSATVSVKARDSGGTDNDGVDLSAAITFTLTVTPVNDAPTATADSFIVLRGTTLFVGLPGVLINDHDVDGDTLTAVKVTSTVHGVLVLASDGSFSYTPTAGYTGPDAFSYKASDGSLFSPVRVVSLTVTAIPPVATPTPIPTPTAEATTTPEPSLDEPTPSIEATPSVEPSSSIEASLAPTDTPAPTAAPNTAGSDGGVSLPVLLVIVLLMLLVGFGAALYVPRWLAAQRGEPLDR
jgi:Bacterial cadherin-like domain/Bacterial Ig domain